VAAGAVGADDLDAAWAGAGATPVPLPAVADGWGETAADVLPAGCVDDRVGLCTGDLVAALLSDGATDADDVGATEAAVPFPLPLPSVAEGWGETAADVLATGCVDDRGALCTGDLVPAPLSGAWATA
jgi:hypothetical protein